MISEPVGYSYKAEMLCPNCTIESLKGDSTADLYDSSDEATMRVLANRAGVDYSDPYSYDTSDFPKPIMDWDLDCDLDGHETCMTCGATLCGDEL